MTKQQYEKAIELMAEYIVTLGRVDYYLCDEIPREIHLKYQPKDDGNYDNEPCQRCVAEYFMMKAGGEKMIIDYELAENCQNPEVYYICYKCGACGRKFEDGILIEEGEENDD